MISTLTAILLAVIIAVVTAIATAMIRDEVMDRLKDFPEWITRKIMQWFIPEAIRDRAEAEWLPDLRLRLNDTDKRPVTRLKRGLVDAVTNLGAVNPLRARYGYPPAPAFQAAQQGLAMALGISSLYPLTVVTLAAIEHVQASAYEWIFYSAQGLLFVSLAIWLFRPWRLAAAAGWLGTAGIVLVWYAGCCLNSHTIQVFGAVVAGVGALAAVARLVAPEHLRDRLGLGLIGLPLLAGAETTQRALASGIVGVVGMIVPVLLIVLVWRLGSRAFQPAI